MIGDELLSDLLIATLPSSDELTADELKRIADEHACSQHPLFDLLESKTLSRKQMAALLFNYDAHASVLRRFLLRAAAIMPEEAVPLVLENVRNEYGNGDYSRNHQLQLRDLAWKSGISPSEFFDSSVESGVKSFIKAATRYYCPKRKQFPDKMKAPAIVSGAITATEILAIKEFAYLQKAFARIGMENHHWFHHVTIELEHSDESLELALYFIDRHGASESVKYGLQGVLDANLQLYDGLLSAIQD